MEIQTPTRPLLIALLVSSLFIGISWAAMIPLWHTPDEQAHFAQAQDIAAIGYRPNPGNSTSADILRSEELLGTRRDRGNNKFTYHPEYRIPYVSSTTGIYEEEIKDFPISMRTEFVTNEATGYPPFYYWMIAGVNRLSWEQDLITRAFLSRLATVAISTFGIYFVFLLGREIFHSGFLALALAFLVSLHPMWRFVGSGVTSDALMNVWNPFVLWGGVRLMSRPSTTRLFIFLISLGLGLFIKPQAVLLFAWAIPLMFWVLVRDKGSISPSMRMLLYAFSGLAVVLFAIALTKQLVPTLVAPYTRLLWVTDVVGIPDMNMVLTPHPTVGEYVRQIGSELYRQTFPWYWGVYRWLSLTLPLWVYRAIKIIILASLLGWMIGCLRRFHSFTLHAHSGPSGLSPRDECLRPSGRSDRFGSEPHRGASAESSDSKRSKTSRFTLLAVSSATYALGLLTWNFFFWKSQGFPIGIQGRYFFPNLPEHMIFLLTGLLLIAPARLRRLSGFLTLTLLLIFHWYSFWFVASSYYDTSLISTFLIQASQYKPWFFKTPWLGVWLLAGIVSSVAFVVLLGYHLSKRPGPAAVNLKKDRL